MPEPESVEPGQNLTLFASLRSFWGVIVAILYTRLDLVTLELEEEVVRAAQLLAVLIGALLCLGLTIFFLLCFLVELSGTHLMLVLGIICGGCVIATVVLGLVARQMILTRPKFLSQTLAELRKDIENLKPVPKKEETK
jgi:uncharacterized membrane protein YqjE